MNILPTNWIAINMPPFSPISYFYNKRAITLSCFVLCTVATRAATDYAQMYEEEILPILEDNCYSCHGDGDDKGKVTFDTFGSTSELMNQSELWVHALKNIRSGMMPLTRKDRIPLEDFAKLESWIKLGALKLGALKLDPAHPDPGRVTLRRLNRVEYHSTIRDLMGIDFRTEEEFPADDTGYGFDNIGDVLTPSLMLLEKYMQAAETIVAGAVPLETHVMPEREIRASEFRGTGERDGKYSELRISLYDPADLTARVDITKAGTYQVVLNADICGSFAYDLGRARCGVGHQWRNRDAATAEMGSRQKGDFLFRGEMEAGSALAPFCDESLGGAGSEARGAAGRWTSKRGFEIHGRDLDWAIGAGILEPSEKP